MPIRGFPIPSKYNRGFGGLWLIKVRGDHVEANPESVDNRRAIKRRVRITDFYLLPVNI
jgi:hypothetical protein